MRDDEALLEAVRKLNQEALVQIFDLYSTALYHFVLRLSDDPLVADHVVRDVFAELLDEVGAGRGPRTNLRSYLYESAYKLVVNRAQELRQEPVLKDFLMKYGVKQFTVTRSPIKDQPLFDAMISAENQLLLDSVISGIKEDLTVDQRSVIILRFLEGFSLRETAEILNKDVHNVKAIQNRAIAKLRMVIGIKATEKSPDTQIADVSPLVRNLIEKIELKLAGDTTTDAPPPQPSNPPVDAPPPDVKKKKKGSR